MTIDGLLIDHPNWAPQRPKIGITPKLTDAELITLAVIQALLGSTSEDRFWLRLHLITTPSDSLITYALTSAKTD